MSKDFFEGVFEIQFPANSIFLDTRGKFAKDLSAEMAMKEWQIVENRIDIFDTDKKRRGIVSYINCAYIIRENNSHKNFTDQVSKFLRKCVAIKAIPGNPVIKRLGVRFTYLHEYDKTFEELLEKYNSRFIFISDTAKTVLDAKVIDIASPLTLETDIGNIRFQTGPMKAKQVKDYIGFAESPAPVNIFIDFDYWIDPNDKFDLSSLIEKVREYSEGNSTRHNKLIEMLQGD
jgi:hypothetical protein